MMHTAALDVQWQVILKQQRSYCMAEITNHDGRLSTCSHSKLCWDRMRFSYHCQLCFGQTVGRQLSSGSLRDSHSDGLIGTASTTQHEAEFPHRRRCELLC